MQEYVPYIIIGVVAAVLIAGTVVVARIAWHRQVRRYVIALTSHKEAIASALKTADSVIASLAEGDTAQLLEFAGPASEERRTLAEIAERMRIEHDELRDLALPKVLWGFADRLCEAAGLLATQAGSVGEAEGEATLDALLVLDLASVRQGLVDAIAEGERVAKVYKVTESSVYGGGLYI